MTLDEFKAAQARVSIGTGIAVAVICVAALAYAIYTWFQP